MNTKGIAAILTDPPTSHIGSRPIGSYLAIRNLAKSLEQVSWRVIVFVFEGNGRLRPVNRPWSLARISGVEGHSLLTIMDGIKPDAMILCLTRESLVSLLKTTQRELAPESPARRLPSLYVVAAPSIHRFVTEWVSGAGMEDARFFPRIGVARVSGKAKKCIVAELASVLTERQRPCGMKGDSPSGQTTCVPTRSTEEFVQDSSSLRQ